MPSTQTFLLLCRLAADYPDMIVTTPKSRHRDSSWLLKHLREYAPLIDRGRGRSGRGLSPLSNGENACLTSHALFPILYRMLVCHGILQQHQHSELSFPFVIKYTGPTVLWSQILPKACVSLGQTRDYVYRKACTK